MKFNLSTINEIADLCRNTKMNDTEQKYHDFLTQIYESRSKFMLYVRDLYKGKRSFRIKNSDPGSDIFSCIVIDEKERPHMLTNTLIHEYTHHIQFDYFPNDAPAHSTRFTIIFHCLLRMAEKKGLYTPHHKPSFLNKEIFGSNKKLFETLEVLPQEFSDIVYSSIEEKKACDKQKESCAV